MFRISGRRPPTTLDGVTIERLLDGGAIDDLPDALRPLGEVLAAASGVPRPGELEGATAAAASFITARAAASNVARRSRSIGASVFSVLVLAASTGTAVAATQGSLPAPMQQVAHETLGVVGISVPSINDGNRSHDHGAPVVAADGSSVSPKSTTSPAVPAASSEPGSNANSSKANSSSGKASNSDSSSNDSAENPQENNGGGQSDGSGSPETPPDKVDKPADQGGGQAGDTPTTPGNSKVGKSQGGGPKEVPPSQAKKG